MKLDQNIQYLDMIRDKIDATIMRRGGISKIPEAFIADNIARACADGKRFTVNYVDLKNSDRTFIMCCYPDVEELNEMIEPLMTKLTSGNTFELKTMWSSITKWHIEIDSRLLKKATPITVDNGSQFVAILCHELGHVINSFPFFVSSAYKMNKAVAGMFSNMMMTDMGKTVLKLCLPIFLCMNGLRIIVSRPGAELNEMAADAQVPNSYKRYLIDYTNNHILTHPDTASGIVVTTEEHAHEYSQNIQFSRSCINLMKRRAAVLKLHLDTFAKFSPSPYLQKVATFISDNACPEDIRRQFAATESFNRSYAACEQKVAAILEASDVSERDILLLQIDIDGMQTLDDKAYVINTICDYIEILSKRNAKEIKKIKDPMKIPKKTIWDEKIERLQVLKKQAMDTKISSYTNGQEYAVYVRYPDGYEG